MTDLASQTRPGRRRFQFHLSTAVVLTIAAGAVLWLNMRVTSRLELAQSSVHVQPYQVDLIGWPYSFLMHLEPLNAYPLNGEIAATPLSKIAADPPEARFFELTSFLDNLFVALLILALVVGAWEGLLRLRRMLAEPPEEVESGG